MLGFQVLFRIDSILMNVCTLATIESAVVANPLNSTKAF